MVQTDKTDLKDLFQTNYIATETVPKEKIQNLMYDLLCWNNPLCPASTTKIDRNSVYIFLHRS